MCRWYEVMRPKEKPGLHLCLECLWQLVLNKILLSLISDTSLLYYEMIAIIGYQFKTNRIILQWKVNFQKNIFSYSADLLGFRVIRTENKTLAELSWICLKLEQRNCASKFRRLACLNIKASQCESLINLMQLFEKSQLPGWLAQTICQQPPISIMSC